MKVHQYTGVFLLAFAPVLGQAASFDCAKASHPDEVAICANPSLDDKDVEMSTKYRYLLGLVAMGEGGNIRDQQREWLAQRRQCGSDVKCLKAVYDDRLKALDKVYDSIDKPL